MKKGVDELTKVTEYIDRVATYVYKIKDDAQGYEEKMRLVAVAADLHQIKDDVCKALGLIEHG